MLRVETGSGWLKTGVMGNSNIKRLGRGENQQRLKRPPMTEKILKVVSRSQVTLTNVRFKFV